jgi:hypothetical protein
MNTIIYLRPLSLVAMVSAASILIGCSLDQRELERRSKAAQARVLAVLETPSKTSFIAKNGGIVPRDGWCSKDDILLVVKSESPLYEQYFFDVFCRRERKFELDFLLSVKGQETFWILP